MLDPFLPVPLAKAGCAGLSVERGPFSSTRPGLRPLVTPGVRTTVHLYSIREESSRRNFRIMGKAIRSKSNLLSRDTFDLLDGPQPPKTEHAEQKLPERAVEAWKLGDVVTRPSCHERP